MRERVDIQQDLDQFTASLLKKGLSADWVGLELMTLGVAMLSRTVGARHMAEHCRLMAAQFDHVAGRQASTA
jgi:hypothetical protein